MSTESTAFAPSLSSAAGSLDFLGGHRKQREDHETCDFHLILRGDLHPFLNLSKFLAGDAQSHLQARFRRSPAMRRVSGFLELQAAPAPPAMSTSAARAVAQRKRPGPVRRSHSVRRSGSRLAAAASK